MVKVDTTNLTSDERRLLCGAINRYGTSGHPYADDETIEFFALDYVREVLNKVPLDALQPKGQAILTTLRSKVG